MRIKKQKKRQGRYIPLEDIKEIDDKYLMEMERVKTRLGYVKDIAIIQTFHSVLLSAYNAEIEIVAREREVDYDIKIAEINERRHNRKPFRRCWLWRLLFQPLTNRAQDIIEARAELDADIDHTAAENAIEDDRKKLPSDTGEKLSKRELKRRMKDKLDEVIKEADTADMNEAFNEPSAIQTEQKPPQEQLRLDKLPLTNVRRARPPRSCRRP